MSLLFMLLYAYCLSDEAGGAGAAAAVTGVGGVSPRLLECGDLWVVVSELQGVQPTVTRENVLAHERVVRRVLAEATPLPFRFGTVAGEEQLRAYVDSRRDRLKAQLDRVRGCVEMSVKVIWDPSAVRDEAAAGPAPSPPAAGSGTAFLEAKRREVSGDEALGRRAREVEARLAEGLAEAVRESRVELRHAQALMLSAAHLVERARLADYRARLDRTRKGLGALRFLTSGPWPPYSFTNVDS